MATCITIDLDSMEDVAARTLADALVGVINRQGGAFGFPLVQGTVVQHIPDSPRQRAAVAADLTHPCCGVALVDHCGC